MRKISTEVLVIGGGATGTGLARDLAMRGFTTTLVERRDFSHGTTGRYHGLLHSGARYVVKDPQAAVECNKENTVLRKIMPHCIEDTQGFFVLTPWDDPQYAPSFLEGCRAAGIPLQELSISEMLRLEPHLSWDIQRCFRVPDAAADSFLASEANAASARLHGAQILNYHEVRQLLRSGSRVAGAVCHDLVKDEPVHINADFVVNAAGAWAGKLAALAGITLQIIASKGTMLALNHRIVHTVINRCKLPSDGDILVPIHTVAVIGTTDVQVSDPDRFAIEPWEVSRLLEEGEKIVPGFKQLRVLRAWAGVRALYQETHATNSRDITRAYVLLDHELRDGVPGLVTITSGKWTTYRLMADVTANLVGYKLGVQRPCRTHEEVLPDPSSDGENRRYYRLGHRLESIEARETYSVSVCECELATLQDVAQAILQGEARTLDDIRRDVRLGMGPCQGGFCTLRAAGLLHRLRQNPPQEANAALFDFLQERWKGLLPSLWGSQLRQERLDELIYCNVLNTTALPGAQPTRLASDQYLPPVEQSPEYQAWIAVAASGPSGDSAGPISGAETAREVTANDPVSTGLAVDTLVIGGGLAGLAAAWASARAGLKTALITKGWGGIHWGSGCIDVLGYRPSASSAPVDSPAAAFAALVEDSPRHPYALAGMAFIDQALAEFLGLSRQAGYTFHGRLERNWMLPNALGGLRPACLAPETMIAGDARERAPMLIVGFEGFLDFFPELAAANLAAQGLLADALLLDLPSLRQRRFNTAMTLARQFDSPEFRAEVASRLKPRLGGAGRVGFPAVLGLDKAREARQDLEARLGLPVFEMPGLPPSIPGIRLHNLLVSAIQKAGGRVFSGMQAFAATAQPDGESAPRVTAVLTEAAARSRAHPARHFILATGGLLGGGTLADQQGRLHETVFGLPVEGPPASPDGWFNRQFWDPRGHPVYRAGLAVDDAFRPVNSSGLPLYANLFAVGATLGGEDYLRQASLDGVGLVTGLLVGKRLSALQEVP